MSSIEVRKNGPAPMAQAPASSWEPSRWMTRLMGFDPFREMMPFVANERSVLDPAFEVRETKDSYIFEADVPGVVQKDLEVSLSGNRLTISGKREAETTDKGDTYYAYERSYGSFSRSFTLPEGVDAASIHADLNEGVLSVVLPKKETAEARKIPVGKQKKA